MTQVTEVRSHMALLVGMDVRDVELRFYSQARSHFSVMSRSRLLEAGVTLRVIERRLDSGEWRVLFPGIYAHAATPESWEQRAYAATEWAGRDAVLSNLSAGYLWGLVEDPPAEVELWSSRYIKAPGVRVHRTSRPLGREAVRRGPFRITDPTRTMIDLAANLNGPELEEALHILVYKRLSNCDRIGRRLAAIGSRGRRGVEVLGYLVRVCPSRPPESRHETRVLRLLRPLKPQPHTQFQMCTHGRRLRIDFAYPHIRLAVEAVSTRFHSLPGDLERNSSKYSILSGLGWSLRLVTPTEIRDDPDGFQEDIRRRLDAGTLGGLQI